MSSAVMASGAMAKHRTKDEIEAREAAEASLKRERPVNLSKPKSLSGAAATYWRMIVDRTEDIELLDDLDREALGIYCQMLARRDRLNRLLDKLLAAACKADADSRDAEASGKLDVLIKQIGSLEKTIMAYADRLGFTPQSRIRLAQRRAAAAAEDENGAFFGDGL